MDVIPDFWWLSDIDAAQVRASLSPPLDERARKIPPDYWWSGGKAVVEEPGATHCDRCRDIMDKKIPPSWGEGGLSRAADGLVIFMYRVLYGLISREGSISTQEDDAAIRSLGWDAELRVPTASQCPDSIPPPAWNPTINPHGIDVAAAAEIADPTASKYPDSIPPPAWNPTTNPMSTHGIDVAAAAETAMDGGSD